MKNILTLILFSYLSNGIAQTLYIESETRMEGAPAMFAKVAESKTHFANGKTLIVTDMYIGKATTLMEEDTVTFVNGKDCYSDSKQNIASVNNEQMVFKNIQVEKSNNTKIILNYECNSAVIKCSVKSGVLTSKQSAVVWYSKKLKEEYAGLSQIQGNEYENDFTKTLMELDGMILFMEVSMGPVTTITEVTKVEKKEFNEDQFKIETKKCKKMRTYKEYADEMSRRNTNSGFRSFPSSSFQH